MFSGISSLFGKKHKQKHEDSVTDPAQSGDDFVILERRHSDEFDRNAGLYPNLDPSQPPPSNLPYAISPSLPNLKDATSNNSKEETKVDMLQGVPFVLSSQILLLDDSYNKSLKSIIKNLKDLKELGEETLFEDFNYDFELEHTASSEFGND